MTGGCEHTTACEFQERLTAAQPGAVIVYATGFLAEDIHQAFLKKDPNEAGGAAAVPTPPRRRPPDKQMSKIAGAHTEEDSIERG